jgi:hypothetical protein
MNKKGKQGYLLVAVMLELGHLGLLDAEVVGLGGLGSKQGTGWASR